ncbi:MAG TPA: CapA family protein [Actinomycetota bacterium]|nr:CapA family protein [Actinomycetota bacterium]
MSALSPPRVARTPLVSRGDLRTIVVADGSPTRPGRPRRLFAIVPFLAVAVAGGTSLRASDTGAATAPQRTPTVRAADDDGGGSASPRGNEGRRGSPPTPRRLTLAFSGDILIHQALWEVAAEHAADGRAFDFRPMFASLRPVVAGADLAICHLEVPLSPDDAELSSYPVFEAPHELAPAIAWAGYDGCSTASNHSLDGGAEGVRATLRWLDWAGLAHAGTARTPREAGRITTYDVGGVTIAHLSASWGFNGFTPDAPWRADRIDVSALLEDARRAERAGADLIVLSLHWGLEYTHTPTAWQEETAERLARSPAIDLIVGHHAHVVQPIARIHGTWVAYGLGNLLSGMTASLGTEAVRDGVVLLAVAERRGARWSIERLRPVPTRVEVGTWRVLPVGRTLRTRALPAALRSELRASGARTSEVLTAFGAPIGTG